MLMHACMHACMQMHLMKLFLSSKNQYRTNFLRYPDRLLIAIQLGTRRRKAFTIFIPSRRKIEFLQKNIAQLNVEFKETNVADHRLNNKNCLSDNNVLHAKSKAVYRVYQKKLNRFEIALNFAKHLFVSGFLYIYI
jgi:hypothetical protein